MQKSRPKQSATNQSLIDGHLPMIQGHCNSTRHDEEELHGLKDLQSSVHVDMCRLLINKPTHEKVFQSTWGGVIHQESTLSPVWAQYGSGDSTCDANPRSTGRPKTVCVLPAPVWPYANLEFGRGVWVKNAVQTGDN